MSAALATPGPTPPPDPPSDRPADTAWNIPIGQVIGLVRRMIGFGKQLAGTMQQRVATPGFIHLAMPFGTISLPLILAHITRGLMRLAALEALLLRRAARGRELQYVGVRLTAPGPRAAVQPAERRKPVQRPDPDALDPACMPTEQEIAAEVRRRPVGAVLADICADFGIVPGADNPFGEELASAVLYYGGDILDVLRVRFRRMDRFVATTPPQGAPHPWLAPFEWPTPRAEAMVAAATGPP